MKKIELKKLTREDIGEDGLGIVGNTYFCGYWYKYYTIIDKIKDISGNIMVVCKWEDNTITTHCTRLDLKYDRLVLKKEEEN